MKDAPGRLDAGARRRITALEAQATPRAVEAALADGHWAVRLAAAQLAADRLSPSRLVTLLASGDDFARRASALNALVRAGRRAVPALLAALEQPQPAVHVFCLQALSRIRCPEAYEALCAAASSPDTLVSQAGLEGLGQQGDLRALPVLRAALSKDQWRALSAIMALGRLAAPEARPELEALLADERYGDAARDALRRLERRSPPGGEAA